MTLTTTDPAPASTMTLTGFSLLGLAPGAGDPTTLPVDGWVPVAVPGGVHEALIAAGQLPHPYIDRNERDVAWVEEREWWYRTRFAAPTDLAGDERLLLELGGVDTVATVYLNGEVLGDHVNQFRPAVHDVTGRVLADNELLVRFSPPLAGLTPSAAASALATRLPEAFGALMPQAPDAAQDDDGAEPPTGAMADGTLLVATRRRKAVFSFGWDFGPRVPPVGLFLPVQLLRQRRAALTGHHVRTRAVDASARTAVVDLLVEADAFAAVGDMHASVVLTSPTGRRHEATVPLPSAEGTASGAGRRGVVRIELADAELWWSHDLGSPALYDVTVELLDPADSAGAPVVLDRATSRAGLRTVVLDRGPDGDQGRLFRLVLNGVPTFSRGANWIPADTLTGSVTPERLRALVAQAARGNMTMLRVWGGGGYEADAFYDACDEAGVLIWHDFAFACMDYDSCDPELTAEVRAEAEYQVRRLRVHPSLALWSGNNEVQMLHSMIFRDMTPGDGWGYEWFHELLPAVVAEHDAGTPYWPGSPFGEADGVVDAVGAVGGVRDGDRHAWEVWHGMDAGAGVHEEYASTGEALHFRRYAHDRGRFISEFGIHASPELETWKRWLPADQLVVHSRSMDHHNKDNPKNKGDDLMSIVTGLPRDLAEYIDFTMICQAEGMKYGVEHYRRNQPHCSGTLIWQFNDCWPGMSWSLVDYDGVPKAGYYAAARAFAPVLASFRTQERDAGLELWVSNSTAYAYEDVVDVRVVGFDGRVRSSAQVPVSVAAGDSVQVWVPSAAARLAADEYAWVHSTSGGFPDNRAFGTDPKDLQREVVPVTWTARTVDGGIEVDIDASRYAAFVHIPSPVPGLVFSDNYFDSEGGTRRTVRITGATDGLDPATLRVASR